MALSTRGTVFAALAVLLVLLAVAGWFAASRRAQDREEKLLRELSQADRALAQAHALDKGWDRAVMEAAARDAAVALFGDTPIDALQLVQVIDKPGVDKDQAVFRVATADGEEHRLTLGRAGGVWGPAR